MNIKKSIGLALALVLAASAPAMAGITWETRGTAKVGGLILGTTTFTVTGAELNLHRDEVASVSQVSTPASGTNGTQFTFKNAAGTAIGSVRTMTAYVSSSAGAQSTAVTGLAALTNGSLSTLITGKVALVTTSAAGLLGITTTASAGSYYITFVLPTGKIITSAVLTVN